MIQKIIHIKNFLPPIISSRNSVELIFKNIDVSKCDKFTLDFSTIKFISRAFADELVKFSLDNNFQFKVSNANNNILAVLSVVRKTQKKIAGGQKKVPVISFIRDKKVLHEFLLSV